MRADAGTQESVAAAYEELLPLLDAMKLHAQGGSQTQETAAHFPVPAPAMTIDPQNPFMRSDAAFERALAASRFGSSASQRKFGDSQSALWGRDVV